MGLDINVIAGLILTTLIPILVKTMYSIPAQIRDLQLKLMTREAVVKEIENHCSKCSLRQEVNHNKFFTDNHAKDLKDMKRELQEMNIRIAEICIYIKEKGER